MKIKNQLSTRLNQTTALRRLAIATSLVAIVISVAMFLSESFRSEKAFAIACESSYTLNWADPTTWTVTCGSVNASNWNVKGLTCTYFSPLFTASGIPGGPIRQVDISARINQSGNLDGNDTAWVYLYVNGVIQNTYTYIGDSSTAVFITTRTLSVPSGGTYMVSIKLKNDKSNELWQIKNGDVTTCLRTLTPLPVELSAFSATVNTDRKVKVDWTTQSELNNDYFTLERSADGSQFEQLARVQGGGTVLTPKYYSFTDNEPLQGNNYYRLSQTDYDGKTIVYNIVVAKVGTKTDHTTEIKVIPNPFHNEFNVTVSSDLDQNVKLNLVSVTGTIVYSNTFTLHSGENVLTGTLQSRVVPGVYSVQVINDNGLVGTAKAICK
ncbi:MAG TPA: T9SS type A sorting domain-containing protein [Bacteroidia bacterium]|nr:T9SS type A sorting domain-containing protein [Bacteroidia bacterium]